MMWRIFQYRPWRSARLAWMVTLGVLLAGVPLFVCMPPWNDVTLHDMVVRSILRGGVLYRDIFDTNLPGIDWAMAAIRATCGWSYEVLRIADLLVIGASLLALSGWIRASGGTEASVAWFVAAAVLFYLFTSEFNHVQRDPWMFLPAVVAARGRLWRCQRGLTASPAARWGGAILEGFVWGLAVWVKPHALVVAFAVWWASVGLRRRVESPPRLAGEFVALVGGGLLAGGPGVAWLIATGAWPYFLDIFLHWNPSYLADSGPLGYRFVTVFNCFRPWSLLHFAALPLALMTLAEAVVGPVLRRPVLLDWNDPQPELRPARVLLAVLYLSWMFQAVCIQKAFDYVHIPLTFLGMAILAGHRWCFGFAYLVWFLVVALVLLAADASCRVRAVVQAINPSSSFVKLEKYPLFDGEVMQLWPRCWREGGSPELRDKIGHYTDIHCGTRWQELTAVAEFLRTLEPPLGPGELNCWHDSTHPLYLLLDLEPATRYMHYGTAFGIRSKRELIADAVRHSRQRYVVSDLVRVTLDRHAPYDPNAWRAGDPLPVWLPPSERAKFPWNQPVVFRCGRYVVHRIDPSRPLGVIRVPPWHDLDRLAELGPDE
ncbi:MAG: hypothetical protein RMJ56_16220 [Gemmataceae bacterium]|nr:hypothetical protein [Gemmata sp.]MDW8199143.1 hypothetical protein [Gemmataceae bacterium]